MQDTDTLTMRPAQPADIAAIAGLWHAGWMDGHAARAPAALMAQRDPDSFRIRTERWIADFRLMERGGQLIGFHLCKGDEVNQFYLDAAARGSGAAMRLMQDAEDHQRARGHGTIWLACAIGNDRARRFYEKAGWRYAGEETHEMETATAPIPLTIWRMEKTL